MDYVTNSAACVTKSSAFIIEACASVSTDNAFVPYTSINAILTEDDNTQAPDFVTLSDPFVTKTEIYVTKSNASNTEAQVRSAKARGKRIAGNVRISVD